MGRPTKEQVDRLLTMTGGAHFVQLQSEVRALREELAQTVLNFDRIARSVGEADGFALVQHKDHGNNAAEELLTEFNRRGEALARVEAVRQYFYCEVGASDMFSAFDINGRLEAALCASNEPNTSAISTPDGQSDGAVVPENPAK